MKSSVLFAILIVAAPAAAVAQETGVQGRWTLTFSGGATVPSGGEFHEGGIGTVLGLPTSVDPKKTGDVFDPGVGWRVGLGYGVSRAVEVFGDFAWKHTAASELSENGVQWIVNGYLLALSALFAFGGRLSDIAGHTRMVVIGVVMFATSSSP